MTGHPSRYKCSCWVKDEPEEVRFALHYGAHSLSCPQFRESLDPVDRANDEELRERKE